MDQDGFQGLQEFRHATRELTSFLAPLEKRCLIWIARRLPGAVNSDHLTALALLAMAGVGASYWLARWYPVALVGGIVCLGLNWFGDSLDGTLARVRGHERPRYGFYVDHVVDVLGILALMGGVALSGYMSPLIAAGVLVAYYLLSIEVFLAVYTLGTFRISFWKIGPTELRLILAVGNLALLVHPTATVFGRQYRLFDVGGLVAMMGLMFTMLWAAAANTRRLYRAEPLPTGAVAETRFRHESAGAGHAC